MKIEIKKGVGIGNSYPVTCSRFPDGQVHVFLDKYLGFVERVVVLTRIASGDDFLATLLVEETLRNAGISHVDLFVTYLLGARMDRRIAPGQPFTLKVIANCLRDRFDRIGVLDPHSEVACALLDAEPVSALPFVRETLERLGHGRALCAPDAGAAKRVEGFAAKLGGLPVVQCLKHRDPGTGALTGFRLMGDRVPQRILIVDDICDGGRTFIEVAKLLRAHGAEWVGLYVTHGIFSKGFHLEGIDQIFTTTSYRARNAYPPEIQVVGPDWVE